PVRLYPQKIQKGSVRARAARRNTTPARVRAIAPVNSNSLASNNTSAPIQVEGTTRSRIRRVEGRRKTQRQPMDRQVSAKPGRHHEISSGSAADTTLGVAMTGRGIRDSLMRPDSERSCSHSAIRGSSEDGVGDTCISGSVALDMRAIVCEF